MVLGTNSISSTKALDDEPSLQPPVHLVFKVVSNSLFGMRHDTLIFKQTNQSYKLVHFLKTTFSLKSRPGLCCFNPQSQTEAKNKTSTPILHQLLETCT